MLWMRETRIRTLTQLELEACQEEIVWMIKCHICEALNRPQEEYPARPLPIPPNYIDNLHSRLIKVQQGVLPFFLFFFFSLISLIADGPHHYHPACGHKGSSHVSPVHAFDS